MIPDEAILCYVDEPWAWFTTASLQYQWGDDWNDKPFQANAGDPYPWEQGCGQLRYEVFHVAVRGEHGGVFFRPYHPYFSVQEINKEGEGSDLWWLLLSYYGRTARALYPGLTYGEFRQLCEEYSITIYVKGE